MRIVRILPKPIFADQIIANSVHADMDELFDRIARQSAKIALAMTPTQRFVGAVAGAQRSIEARCETLPNCRRRRSWPGQYVRTAKLFVAVPTVVALCCFSQLAHRISQSFERREHARRAVDACNRPLTRSAQLALGRDWRASAANMGCVARTFLLRWQANEIPKRGPICSTADQEGPSVYAA